VASSASTCCFSRTATRARSTCSTTFGRAFHQADTVLILDIYAASERPIEGVTAEAVAERIRQFGHRGVEYVGTIERGVDALLAIAQDGDLVMTLGAGNVWQAGDLVLARLRQKGEGKLMPREKARPPFRWRLWLTIFAWCAIFISSAVAARQAHRYVLSDPQFILSGEDRNALILKGVTYASRAKLLRIFASDYGRSIFAVPLDERRRRLLAIDWVEDAAVSRVWPNRLVVRIAERQPVAFVSLPLHGGSGSAARFLLVDAQGVLLDPPQRAQFAFPVLTGLSDDQTDAERHVRVRAMQSLMDDLGPAGQNISEIDAAAPDDLTVVAQVEGRSLELKLGDGNYGRRLQNFLLHYPEIRKHAANVTTFDLRLDDRITAKEQSKP
jgi:cell division protein FtsQ